MGSISSLHCIGMCGPIAIAIPFPAGSRFSRFAGSFLYNTGRIITYLILGIIAGSAGSFFNLFGFAQFFSIAMGLLIIALIFAKPGYVKAAWINNAFASLRSILQKQFQKKTFASSFLIGLLNGLLPCGSVYLALAAAGSTGNISDSAIFMVAFGAGTFPLMWALTFFGSMITPGLRRSLRKAYPVFMCAVAVLFVLRGMGLSIPYISPSLKHSSSSAVVIECHK